MSIRKELDAAASQKTWLQRSAEESLAPNLFMVELRGAPKILKWPPICANCGGGASERIRVRKAFYPVARWGRGYNHVPSYKTVVAEIPFCYACAELHRAEARKVSMFRR